MLFRSPWGELVAPAIQLADEGLLVDWMTTQNIASAAADLQRYPAARELYLVNGLPPVPAWSARGEVRLPQKTLADTLRHLAGAGPRDFYERLRTMPPQELAKIDMTRIDFINQLYGQGDLKRAQRRKARFMNTTMIATLLGAVASDALESGQVVSGVGGQYNFVAMAHALPDARLLMMLRATHDNKDGLKSSIVWNYGHVTIPRHLRDIIITEYGVADVRGQPDSEVVKRLIAVADSRFQDELVKQAKAHGKLERDYEVPERYRNNLPEALEEKLHPWAEAGLLPPFPFGTDLTADELKIVGALKKLKHATQHPSELLTVAFKSFWEGKQAPQAYLERLGLADAHSFKDAVIRRLFAGNL